MNKPIRFSDNATSALVIVFPPVVTGLFNPEVHGLVRRVQEQLQGVHVTYALSSGSAPTLRDAVAAARFAGCDSSVLVCVGEGEDAWAENTKSAGDFLLQSSSIPAELDVSAVVNAFNSVMADAGRAA